MSRIYEAVSDLLIGRVVEVTGTTARVELHGDVSELTRSYEGRVYPVGQIGSVVKIHFGRRIVFGFVTLLRMRSEELTEEGQPIPRDSDQRVMEVELFAEGSWIGGDEGKLSFSRGVSTYPLPQQGVYLITREEADALYSAAEGSRPEGANPLVPFGRYLGTSSAQCRANIDKMFGMHCAVLGSTGAGKSGAVAAILHSLLDHQPTDAVDSGLAPRVVIIDPHGEYGAALEDRALIYRAYDPIGTEETAGEPISLPYWLMSADEFRQLIIGKTEYEATSQHNIVYKALAHARMVHAGLVQAAPTQYGEDIEADDLEIDAPRPVEGANAEEIASFNMDQPSPFSLDEFHNHIRYLQAVKPDKRPTQRVSESEFVNKYRSILDKLRVVRRDPRLRFLMKEGEIPLSHILAQFVGQTNDEHQRKDVRIVDISGLPNEVAGPLTAMLARLLFQYKLYQSLLERERDPLLLICEEAHRYVPDRGEAQYAAAQTAIRRVAREGRKYGMGLMLVSQRPSDVESTVISQCGTWLVLRLTNSNDQQYVSRFLPDSLAGMTRALPALGQQEALFVGEGSALPARIRINDLAKEQLPRSWSVSFADGWSSERLGVDELRKIASRMNGEQAEEPAT